MIALASYGCSSSAGAGVAKFWDSLESGRHHALPAPVEGWPVSPSPIPNVCAWNPQIKKNGAEAALVSQLLGAWQEACSCLSGERREEAGRSLGVIFSSTKGMQEDVIWAPPPGSLEQDPLTPVLSAFIRQSGLKPRKSVCVSNACASSHGAVFLAGRWLESGEVSHVLVLAADFIGPFVVNGFQSLRALSKGMIRPFAADRDGLNLGDAAAALLFVNAPLNDPKSLIIEDIALDNEGHAVTRPAREGESLQRIYAQMGLPEKKPDLVIAHGTGTVENDRVEDRALAHVFKGKSPPPPVTSTKWCIGHTLGASGAMDLIAGAEMLRRQRVFKIGNTRELDKNLFMTYLGPGGREWERSRPLHRILINSLGFGGAHAALLLARREVIP